MSRSKKREAPSLNPSKREDQLINSAMNAAEKQMNDGTASAAVIVHFLRLGSEKSKLESEKLKKENLLLEAKTKDINTDQGDKGDAKKAIDALSMYKSSSADDHE